MVLHEKVCGREKHIAKAVVFNFVWQRFLLNIAMKHRAPDSTLSPMWDIKKS